MKQRLLHALYASGLLRFFHHLRNRDTLTVVLFHRVADFDISHPRSRWPGWTVTPAFFEQCLRFFVRHYHPVSAADILNSIASRSPLPSRALLITFDDGWLDTAQVAAPILRRYGLPALLFAVGSLGDGTELWQEPITRAWLGANIAPERWQTLWRAAMPTRPCPRHWSFLDLQTLLAALQDWPPAGRAALLLPLGIDPPSPHSMMDAADLRAFATPPLDVGAHGLSHLPLTLVRDPRLELLLSRRNLERILGRPPGSLATMSYPHGQYSPALHALAAQAGYRCLFTSDALLNKTSRGIPAPVLGRIEPDMRHCCAPDGKLSPETLASLLFRLPRRALAGLS
jgi:peptidoglycan/xylan/chitin deacetylase (PgdA/CDA1 family)